MMMKYLVLFAVLVVAYLFWRNARLKDDRTTGGSARRRPPPAAGPQEMVACRTCGLHLPRSEAVFGSSGAPFCCQEHRLGSGS
jgi:uncharacterized protein